jgi:hypothetical protein
MKRLTFGTAILSTMALSACASAPKRHDIANGDPVARIGAHTANLADILEQSKDAIGATKALRAYCEPRSELIEKVYEDLYAMADDTAVANPRAAEGPMSRFAAAMAERQSWYESMDFATALTGCMRMPKEGISGLDLDDGGLEGTPTDWDTTEGSEIEESGEPIFVWDAIGESGCYDFAGLATDCYVSWPKAQRMVAVERLEKFGEEIMQLNEGDDNSRVVARCEALGKITECNAIFAELGLKAP